MVFVKDNKGRVLIVGAGDVAFDGEGRVRDGDMLTVYDPATREMDFVHAKDVTLNVPRQAKSMRRTISDSWRS